MPFGGVGSEQLTTKALGNSTLTHGGQKKIDFVMQVVMLVLWKTLQIDVRCEIHLECTYLHLN